MANLMRPITDAITLLLEAQNNPDHDIRISSGTRLAPCHWIHAACAVDQATGRIYFEVKNALKTGHSLGSIRLKIGEHMAPSNALCTACRRSMTEPSPLLEIQP